MEESQWKTGEKQQLPVHGLQQLATTLLERRREKGIKEAFPFSQMLPKTQKSLSYQRGLLAGGGQPKQLTCPGNPDLQIQACLLRQCRWLRRLGGWPEGRHLTMWSQWRAALLLLQTDGLRQIQTKEDVFKCFQTQSKTNSCCNKTLGNNTTATSGDMYSTFEWFSFNKHTVSSLPSPTKGEFMTFQPFRKIFQHET